MNFFSYTLFQLWTLIRKSAFRKLFFNCLSKDILIRIWYNLKYSAIRTAIFKQISYFFQDLDQFSLVSVSCHLVYACLFEHVCACVCLFVNVYVCVCVCVRVCVFVCLSVTVCLAMCVSECLCGFNLKWVL